MNRICEKCGQMISSKLESINNCVCLVTECGCGKKINYLYAKVEKQKKNKR